MNKILTHTTHIQKALLYLALAAFILLFGNNWVSLWDQDEAAYAGFAKNMVESGNWLMPEFMWSEVHRKPPLHFWNIAISYKIFGINEFAVRFPSVIFVLLTLALTFFGGRKIFGERESFNGMVVLSTSFLVMSLAKVSVTDATLLFFTTLCAVSMLHVLLYRSKLWVFLFWLGFAMALLTKGPPIILFTAVFAFILFVLHPNRKNLLLLHPWFFLPVALLPLWYWGYLCTQAEGGKEFIEWMIDWYILKRVGGSVFGQTGPPGTHLLGLLVFFLPYFLFFPKAIFNGVKHIFNKEKNADFLLAAWFIAGWFIFEFTPSKLPAYVIAAHVPLSLLIAKLLLNEAPKKAMLYIHISLNGIIYLALIVAPIYMGFTKSIQISFTVAGVLFLLASVFILRNRNSDKFSHYLMVKNVAFQLVLWCVLLPVADELKNGSLRVAQHVEQVATKDAQVIIANNFSHPPSLPFYLMQRFENVSEEYNNETLLQHYANKNAVLILTREQKDFLVHHHPDLSYTEIKPFFTDRIQQDGYFVVRNF
jgi:4-amino-4-deoxy-L-arabinose transferase-like glycosyltransferase